jgi:hypothetical protein
MYAFGNTKSNYLWYLRYMRMLPVIATLTNVRIMYALLILTNLVKNYNVHIMYVLGNTQYSYLCYIYYIRLFQVMAIT